MWHFHRKGSFGWFLLIIVLQKINSLRGLRSCRAPLSSHCANFGKSESGIFAVKKDDHLIASNARSDLLGKNYTWTRNSSLAKSFWCYLLSAQKVAETSLVPPKPFDTLSLLFDKSNQKQPRWWKFATTIGKKLEMGDYAILRAKCPHFLTAF